MTLFLILATYICSLIVNSSTTKFSEYNRTTEKLEFLVTNKNEIWRVQENGDRHQYSTNASTIGDVDYHLGKKILFWIDSEKHEIHSQPLDVNSILPYKTFKQHRNWKPVALAVDFIADKVYVVDVFGVKIDVFELDGRYHSIAFGVNLVRPTDIKLDPYKSCMFILDGFRILRINIDGSLQFSIITKGISNYNGFFIDINSQKIYWMKNRNLEMMSIDYYGENLKSLGKSSSSSIIWSKFAIFNQNILWANKFINYKSKCCCKYLEAGGKFVFHSNPLPTIKFLHYSLKNVKFNLCHNDNGGCEHMCILIRKTYNKSNDSYRCSCNVGWILSENLKNCTRVGDVVIYAQSTIIKSHLVENCSNTFCEPYLPIIQNRSTFIDFVYSFKDNYLYYLAKHEYKNCTIYKIHPDESGSETFLMDEQEDYQSLALDWETSTLYFTNSFKGTINMMETKDKPKNSILVGNLEQPEDIVFYFKTGHLYFFQTNQSTRITFFSSIFTNGTNLTIFNNIQLKKNCGFSIDYDNDEIYWYEWSKNYLQHANLDLTDVHIIQSNLTKNLYSISIYDKWIYFATIHSEGLWRIDKKTGQQQELILADLGNRITKIKIVNVKLLSQYKDCSHILSNNRHNNCNIFFSENVNKSLKYNYNMKNTTDTI